MHTQVVCIIQVDFLRILCFYIGSNSLSFQGPKGRKGRDPEVFNTTQGALQMLMKDKIRFGHCINFAKTKEIMAYHILYPHHIFIGLKAFILLPIQFS